MWAKLIPILNFNTVMMESAPSNSLPSSLNALLFFFIGMLVALVLVILLVRRIDRSKPRKPIPPKGEKERWLAGVLSVLGIGLFGIQRYYLGYKKQGISQTFGYATLLIGLVSVQVIIRYLFKVAINDSIKIVIFIILIVLVIILGVYTLVIPFWAIADFIRILTGKLKPVDGTAYKVRAVKIVSSATDSAAALEKLAQLHTQGVLSDDEFNAKKQDILSKM